MAEVVAADLTAEAKGKLKRLIEESRTLNILFTGKTGAGKSSLANALVGREVCPEGETLNPETTDVFKYSADILGVDVTIWDCPGLQDGISNESEYLRKMATKCKELDLVLYCTRMDDTRIRDEDYETIKTLTYAFGEGIWKNTIFTLTFANMVKKAVRGRSQTTATPIDQKEYFLSRLSQWELKLKEALKRAGVSQEVVSNVVVVPVGYQDDLILPDRDNWLSMFWLGCLKRVNERATLALLKISADRLPDSTVAHQEGTEIIKDLILTTGMTSGYFAGAVAGAMVGGPVGFAIGGVVGMTATTIPLLIQTIKEEATKKA